MAKQIEWSPTRIDAANYCIMRYYLKYIEKTPSLKPSFYLKGNLLHTIIKIFGIGMETQVRFQEKAQRDILMLRNLQNMHKECGIIYV